MRACFFFVLASVFPAATRTKRGGEGEGDPHSFEDHAAFRDAMDDLGLLVGLGQQEVLTLVSYSVLPSLEEKTEGQL